MGRCVVVVGGIASGKTTLAKALEKEGFRKIVTYTSRPKKHGEVDGVDYHFISESEFKKKYNAGFFAEATAYKAPNGCYYYGSAKEDYHRPENTVLVLNPQGIINLSQPAFVVYLDIKEDILVTRAKERGDYIEDIRNRVHDDKLYFEELVKYIVPDLTIQSVMPVDTMVEYITSLLEISSSQELHAI